MVIYGINPVSEALESQSSRLERILVTRGKTSPRLQKVIELARSKGVTVGFEPAQVLQRTASTSRHQQVVAVLSEIGYVSLEEMLTGKPSLLLLADGVEDPHNLGAVLRTAEAAGVDGVVIPDRRSCSVTAAVFKSSAGAAAHLKIARVGNVVQTIETLKKSGLWIVGLDLQGGMRPEQIDVSLPLVVIVGGEHRGVRRLVREHCDFLVSLPMKGIVSSLNLSVAVGILLYQVVLKRDPFPAARSQYSSTHRSEP